MNDDEYHQAELERERQSEEALEEARQKGVSVESLKVLARETGCVRWALEHSLKEKRA